MNESSDPMITAMSLALCDILTREILKLRAVVQVLERKAVLSSDEVSQAITNMPPETAEEIFDELQSSLRTEMLRLLEKRG